MDDKDQSIGTVEQTKPAAIRIQELERSVDFGKLIDFLYETKDSLKERMMKTSAYAQYKVYLQDISYLPMTLLNTHYPIISFLHYYGQVSLVSDDKGERLLFGALETYNRDSEDTEGSKGCLETFFYLVDLIEDKQLEAYLTLYARLKKSAIDRLDNLSKNIMTYDSNYTKEIQDFDAHKKWLKKIKENITSGDYERPVLNELAVSAFQYYRDRFIIDQILQVQYNIKLESLKKTNSDFARIREQYEQAIMRNDALQDKLCESNDESKRFHGRGQIPTPFQTSKVSIAVRHNALESLTQEMITQGICEATAIEVTYEGIPNSCTFDLDDYRMDPHRIQERERKLLLSLAFLSKDKESNNEQIAALLIQNETAVSRLNTLLRFIFSNRKQYINRSGGRLEFNISLDENHSVARR